MLPLGATASLSSEFAKAMSVRGLQPLEQLAGHDVFVPVPANVSSWPLGLTRRIREWPAYSKNNTEPSASTAWDVVVFRPLAMSMASPSGAKPEVKHTPSC